MLGRDGLRLALGQGEGVELGCWLGRACCCLRVPGAGEMVDAGWFSDSCRGCLEAWCLSEGVRMVGWSCKVVY